MQKFCCEICGKFYTTKSSLKTHERTHHGMHVESTVKCHICSKFVSAKQMSSHLKTYHGGEVECPECKKKFKSLKYLWDHQNKVHEVVDIKCINCEKTFIRKRKYYSHLRCCKLNKLR